MASIGSGSGVGVGSGVSSDASSASGVYNWCKFVPLKGETPAQHVAPDGCLYCKRHVYYVTKREATIVRKKEEADHMKQLQKLTDVKVRAATLRSYGIAQKLLEEKVEEAEADLEEASEVYNEASNSKPMKKEKTPPPSDPIVSALANNMQMMMQMMQAMMLNMPMNQVPVPVVPVIPVVPVSVPVDSAVVSNPTVSKSSIFLHKDILSDKFDDFVTPSIVPVPVPISATVEQSKNASKTPAKKKH